MNDLDNKADYIEFLAEIGLTEEAVDAVTDILPEPLKAREWEPYELHGSSIHGKGVFSMIDAKPGCPLAIMKVSDDWTVAGRYTNHSPEPNCYVYKTGNMVMMEAYTNIKAGDELLIDYRDMKDALEHTGQRCQIVDDFCPYIDSVVESVKSAGFATWLPEKGKVGSSVYEGMGFWGNHAPMIASIINHTGAVIVPNTMFFRITKRDTESAYIHSDRSTGAHTCVCYLSDHSETYGTGFYRHKPTGLLEMPSFEDQETLGIAEQLAEDMVARTPDKWEMVDFVQGQYNRAVIFNAALFHSRVPITGFGTNQEEGRLIWASHFYKLKGSGELC